MTQLSSFDHLDALPTDVVALLLQAEQENVECGSTWYSNLIRTVFPDHQCHRFYVVRRGAQVVAVLPVKVEAMRMGRKISALGNFYTTLYQPAFVRDLQAQELVPLLESWQRGPLSAAVMQFAPMDPAGQAYQLLMQACKLAGWRAFGYFSFGNWYLPVNMGWQDYYDTRDSKLRHTIERMGKKFAKAGGKLEILTEPAGLSVGIDAYTTIYAKSWKKPEPYPDFMPGLMKICAEKGWLRLGMAWLDGQPIAAQVWIVAHGRAEIYKLAYDEHFKAYAPGTLLSAMLMRHVIEVDQVREVDYLIGDDPYKKTWVSHRRERWGMVAYNPRTLMGLAVLLREVVGRAVKPWIVRIRAKRHSPGK